MNRQTGLELEYGGKTVEPDYSIVDTIITTLVSMKGAYSTLSLEDTELNRRIICLEYDKQCKNGEFTITCLLDCEDNKCSGICLVSTINRIKARDVIITMLKDFKKDKLKIVN